MCAYHCKYYLHTADINFAFMVQIDAAAEREEYLTLEQQ
jgi:hypothetical protein